MGIRYDSVRRGQDQPSVSRELSLNQGTVAITMKEPTKAAKSKLRKSVPEKEKPRVQSDARAEDLEVGNKNQGTRCSHCRSLLFSYKN